MAWRTKPAALIVLTLTALAASRPKSASNCAATSVNMAGTFIVILPATLFTTLPVIPPALILVIFPVTLPAIARIAVLLPVTVPPPTACGGNPAFRSCP